MKKILILVAIFLIGIFSSAVFAADWMRLDNQNYIKLEKVDSTNRLFYWVKILNKGDMRAIKNRKVSYKLSYMMSDCSNNTQSVLIIYTYSGSDLIDSWISPFYRNPGWGLLPVTPQTRGEFIQNAVCGQ